MRKIKFMTGEIYHVYNRGNNKRPIFLNNFDLERFFLSMNEFNVKNPIGSIYEESFRKKDEGSELGSLASKLVDFVNFCLNPNHFHFTLIQLDENGIEKFMHRVGTGFTMYFNQKNKSAGSLFQGPFKAKHVDSNEYLLHLSAYINLNDRAHQIANPVPKSIVHGSVSSALPRSSWQEYISGRREADDFCNKEIILSQFKNCVEYKKFAENSLRTIRERKILDELLKEEIDNNKF